MRHLQAFHEKYSENGLVMLGLNKRDRKDLVRAFMEKHGLAFPMLLGGDEKVYRIMKQYGNDAIPLHCIIDRKGKVRGAWYGYRQGHPRERKLLERLGVTVRVKEEKKDPKPKAPGPLLVKCRKVYEKYYDLSFESMKANRPIDANEAWADAAKSQGFESKASFFRTCSEKLDPEDFVSAAQDAAMKHANRTREWSEGKGREK